MLRNFIRATVKNGNATAVGTPDKARAKKNDNTCMPIGLEQLRPPSTWQRRIRLIIAFIATVVICGLLDLAGFNYLELKLKDYRFSAYEKRNGDLKEKAMDQIVLVPLTDESFIATPEYPNPLPGPPVTRNYHARIIRELARAGAKVIVFDFIFDADRPHDKEFAAAAKSFKNIVWARAYDIESKTFTKLVEPLRQASPLYGHINVPVDDEHPFVQSYEPVIQSGGEAVPFIGIVATMTALGLEQKSLHRVPGGWQAGDLFIPMNNGYTPITYFNKAANGPTGNEQIFPAFPYEQIIHLGINSPVYREVLRDKIVLVGDMTVVNKDRRPTPVGEMYGLEIHAHAIATLLLGTFIRPLPFWMNFSMICVLTAIICLITGYARLIFSLLGAVGLLIIFIFFNGWLFVDHGIWLHAVAPSVAIALGLLNVLFVRNVLEQRDKQCMHVLLQRNLSPELADYVISHLDECILGGKRTFATVLFSDIRGFTSMSEKLEPEEVVERLNEYLNAMTKIVFRHNGTLDKYVGDAIMALYGAPFPYPDHARRAVATAIDMEAELLRLQQRWREQGLPLIDIGIGINTGEMVVGNMGSEERFNYTCIGDSVNLASRVESLNKDLKTRILITDATYEWVQAEVKVCGPKIVQVKGKEEDVRVYQVLGWHPGGECLPWPAETPAGANGVGAAGGAAVAVQDREHSNPHAIPLSGGLRV